MDEQTPAFGIARHHAADGLSRLCRSKPSIESTEFFHIIQTMQTVTLEELHADPYRIDRSIEAGEPIAVIRNGKRVARFLPDAPDESKAAIQWPDVRARVKAIFGDRIITSAEAEDMRAYENGELAK